MTKLRRNSMVGIVCRDEQSGFETMPIVLAGGPAAEVNRAALVDHMQRAFGGVWSARIVMRWRSTRHLIRWTRSNRYHGNERLYRPWSG